MVEVPGLVFMLTNAIAISSCGTKPVGVTRINTIKRAKPHARIAHAILGRLMKNITPLL